MSMRIPRVQLHQIVHRLGDLEKKLDFGLLTQLTFLHFKEFPQTEVASKPFRNNPDIFVLANVAQGVFNVILLDALPPFDFEGDFPDHEGADICQSDHSGLDLFRGEVRLILRLVPDKFQDSIGRDHLCRFRK